MPLILRRSLIFFALLIGGLVLYSLWYGIKADRYEETAVPYLESALPKLTSWNYEQLKPMLSPDAQLDFENEKLQAAYRLFSQLGELKSIGKPQYITDRNDTSKELGDIEIIDYQVPLQFDSGPAVIKIKLVADGKSYYIHRFGFQSEIFVDKTPSD
jgi:hypothetical protein